MKVSSDEHRLDYANEIQLSLQNKDGREVMFVLQTYLLRNFLMLLLHLQYVYSNLISNSFTVFEYLIEVKFHYPPGTAILQSAACLTL